MPDEPTVRLTAVRRLYEVSARMGAGLSLADTLQSVVDGVVDGLGFGVAALNLRRPDGRFELIAVAGSPQARQALLGTVTAADIFDAEFALAEVWGRLRFVPHERLPAGEPVGWVPDVPVPAGPNAWHPLDALFAPLLSSCGDLLGMLSVDLPEERRRPGPVHRELLEIFATQAGLAIDTARQTDQLQADKARLEGAESTFRLVFEGAGNGMVTIALDPPDLGLVVQANPAFCRLSGYSRDELIGSRFTDYLHDEACGQTDRELAELTRSRGPYRFERRFLRADGAGVWLAGTAVVVDQGPAQSTAQSTAQTTGQTAGQSTEQSTGQVVGPVVGPVVGQRPEVGGGRAPDPDCGRVGGQDARARPRLILIQVDDVTARRDAEQELRYDAAHDPLTGLPNRRLLRHRFSAALLRCRRTGRRGALLFCDLDRFKSVNDEYGHEAGDDALREIADRLLAQVQRGDTVARLGGDEFAVLAENIAGADLAALTERIARSIARPLRGIDVLVTASIGTAVITPYVADLDELLRLADDAMYQAKRRR